MLVEQLSHNVTSFQDSSDSWIMKQISGYWEAMIIEQGLGPSSGCDQITYNVLYTHKITQVSSLSNCERKLSWR